LYQQRPSIEGGNIIKSDWFITIPEGDFNRSRENHPIHIFMDTAFTDSAKNDPTGFLCACEMRNKIYITHAKKVLMKFPDLVRYVPKYAYEHDYSPNSSTIRIEPKANGISVIDQLRESTQMNVTRTPSPTESKETRLNVFSSTVECGRVILVEGQWNDEFITEVCGFPNAKHDEYVDLLCYCIDYFNRKTNSMSVKRLQSILR
jgi:predicted phage terminase large subunit-like protein